MATIDELLLDAATELDAMGMQDLAEAVRLKRGGAAGTTEILDTLGDAPVSCVPGAGE